MSQQQFSAATLRAAFISVCVIFLMVGFSQFTTGTLVEYLKGLFQLSHSQSQLISLTFFLAYFVMALPAERLLAARGYKYGIVIGLSICCLGALLFIPASMVLQYWAFLGAVCVLGIGVATLQVGINPYVAVLGADSGAAGRVSIANGCTALGSILAPQVASLLFLKDTMAGSAPVANAAELAAKASVVQMPFGVVAGIFLVLALVFGSMKLPEVSATEEANAAPFKIGNYPWLILGILGIFLYMGGQISVINLYFRPYLQQYTALSGESISNYLSLFFILQMIGRFAGSAIMRFMSAGALLAIAGLGMVACLVLAPQMGSTTLPILFAIMGLFDAVCFGNIFSLAIKGLGPHTKKGSSLLFMAVLGGAILPTLVGQLVDSAGLNTGLWAVAACYLYAVFYGLVGNKVGQKVVA